MITRLLFVIALYHFQCHVLAFDKNAYTPRLYSLAGAGVASVLLNESAILNPASVAFFKESSLMYAEGNSLRSKSENKSFQERSLIISDTSSRLKGNLSYQDYRYFDTDITKVSSSMSSILSKSSAHGLILHYIDESVSSDNVFYRVDYGLLKVLEKNLTFGFVLKDLFKSGFQSREVLTGFHYNPFDQIALILDGSYLPDAVAENKTIVKTAIQIEAFDSFYIRYGIQRNEANDLEVKSGGIAWSGPRFSLEYSRRVHVNDELNTDPLHNLSITLLFNE